jgi:hypothetical protein
MPEPAQAINDTTDLERQVGDLLEQMQAGTQSLADEVKTPPAPPGAAAPPPGVETALTDAAAALDATPAPPATESATPSATDPAVENLTPPAVAAPAAEAAASAPADASAASLDEKLAGLADELIKGELPEEPVAPQAAAPPPPVLPPPPAPSEAPEKLQPAAKAMAPAAKPPVEEPQLTPAPAPKPSPIPKEPADQAPLRTRSPSLVRSLVMRLMGVTASPLSARPHLREVLGWVALVQAFLAACVWVWTLFVRSNAPVDPPPAPVAKETESAGEGHAESGSHEGGPHEKAKKAKKASKKPTHTASAEHH